MKNYKEPKFEIVKFSHEDIMTVSNVDALQVAGGTGSAEAEYTYQGSGGTIKYGQF